jgi:transposase InsO family protein
MDERIRLIGLWNEGQTSVTELSRAFGISRKTVYKWLERYEARGPEGLAQQSPVAHHHPHATPEALVSVLVEIRKERPTWGPKKLRARLAQLGMSPPASSTIGELLKKHGLIRPRRRRVYPPRMPSELAQTTRPNDTWCVDFKGHFALGDQTRCHPLTVTDQVSRYLLKCESIQRPDTAHVKVHFERAFREYGLPLRIRSDNGPPFATAGIGGLSELSVWWIKLGIQPERIEPGHPEQNGRHERMHRTLGEETARPARKNAVEQQLAFDRFRADYNNVRPHEALGQTSPSIHYSPSTRTMPEVLKSPEYPEGTKVRKLDQSGRLSVAGNKQLLVSRLLKNEPIGLVEREDDRFELFYGDVLLGHLSLRNKDVRIQRVK